MFEKLLAVLTALVTAIEANTAALNGAKEPKKKKEPAPAEPAASAAAPAPAPALTAAPPVAHPSAQDVRDAAKGLLDATNNQDSGLFAKLAAAYGVKKISEVPEDKRREVIDIIKKAMPPAASPAEAI